LAFESYFLKPTSRILGIVLQCFIRWLKVTIQRAFDSCHLDMHTNWLLKNPLLLRSHQASQQTNFGRVRDQSARCQAHLKNFGCLYITAFASISSNRSSMTHLNKKKKDYEML